MDIEDNIRRRFTSLSKTTSRSISISSIALSCAYHLEIEYNNNFPDEIEVDLIDSSYLLYSNDVERRGNSVSIQSVRQLTQVLLRAYNIFYMIYQPSTKHLNFKARVLLLITLTQVSCKRILSISNCPMIQTLLLEKFSKSKRPSQIIIDLSPKSWTKNNSCIEVTQKNSIEIFLQSSLSYILLPMVHAYYCISYPKWPCVEHEVNMWYSCCIMSFVLEPSTSFHASCDS